MFDPFKHYYSIDDRSYFYFYLNDKDGNGVTSRMHNLSKSNGK